ncbi:DUF2807 domain-containing protein [Hymenobacter sp. H14-R3]|uniref:GIN domain-containing protein n=1 Tax=Hymenobacter sp. H14-R3 TaxID=3046308 RepID=UPI0024B9C54C|nr:DUF2807 domain-containing protein [Hymenobacter sp. H14-R3]MDJ0365803.1 DUF2807 domain-containing protein [Hymenobacter sp. H14-R3]
MPTAEGLFIEGAADVTVAEGSPQRIVAAGSPRQLNHLTARTRGGILRLHSPADKAGWWQPWQPAERLQLTITLPKLTRLHLAGTSSLAGLTPFTAPTPAVELAGVGSLTLRVANTRTSVAISGAGTVTMGGTTTTQQVSIRGVGTYHGFGLLSKVTTASLRGTGTEEVTATQALAATAAGIGTIRYRGRPATTALHANGLGSVRASQ